MRSLLLVLLLAGCTSPISFSGGSSIGGSPRGDAARDARPPASTSEPEAAVEPASDRGAPSEATARMELPPAHAAKPDWKERVAERYLFLEQRGDYRELGSAMRLLLERAGRADVQMSGPPFALFYDDPGRVETSALRARVCLPVSADAEVPEGLSADLLPSGLVVYARVSGAYPEAPRAYPALFRMLNQLGWSASGPVREIYLVNPAEASDGSQLVAEIQVPAQLTAR